MLRPPLPASPLTDSSIMVARRAPGVESGPDSAGTIGNPGLSPADRVVKRLRRLPRRLAARRRLAIRDRRAGLAPVVDRTEGQNRDLTRRLYDGPAGAVLAFASAMSLHEPLIGQLLERTRTGAPRTGARGSTSPNFRTCWTWAAAPARSWDI